MANLTLKTIAYHHDHIYPLVTREVVPEGITLEFDRSVGLAALYQDESYLAGETSLGLYMLRTSQGYRDFVGLPIFPMRQFRHRCFLVKRGSPMLDRTSRRSKGSVSAWTAGRTAATPGPA